MDRSSITGHYWGVKFIPVILNIQKFDSKGFKNLKIQQIRFLGKKKFILDLYTIYI